MGDVEIVVKVRVPEGFDKKIAKRVGTVVAIDTAREFEKRVREAMEFERIIAKSKLSEEDAIALAEEAKKNLAKRYGVV